MPRDVAELAQSDQRGELAHPVLGPSAPGSRAGGVRALRRSRSIWAIWISSMSIISNATLIRSPASSGQLYAGEELAAGERAQIVRGAGDPVVIQRRADPLHPAGALVDQRVAQPGA